jgi:hypothetical protein
MSFLPKDADAPPPAHQIASVQIDSQGEPILKSPKCVACGFVGRSDVENCKACGAPLHQHSAHASAVPVYNNQYEQPQGQDKRLANGALILGIVSFFTLGIVIVGAIAGIVVSTKAIGRVKREPWRYGGRGTAVAGLVLNIMSLTSVIPFAIIASIAIPNLLASARAANEGSAVRSLQEISLAQTTYHSNFGKFGTIEELAAQNLINPRLRSGARNGYLFTVALTTDEMNVEGFAAVAVPENYRYSGIRSFYIDETAVIRAGDNYGGPSTKTDDPLDLNPGNSRRARRFDDRPQTVY